MRRAGFAAAILFACLLIAGAVGIAGAEARAVSTRVVSADEREARLVLPATLGDVPLPLVVLLHGFGSSADGLDRYLGISRRVGSDRFALLLPEGTRNWIRMRFWNATPACCDFFRSGADDAGYLRALVQEVERIVAVGRVYVIGYSNGGFMAHRLACDGMPKLAGIAVLAGSSFERAERCDGAAPVTVLQMHGDEDGLVAYEGDPNPLLGRGGFPGAEEAAARWARRGGCDAEAARTAGALDLERRIAGAETAVAAYGNCDAGIRVELWTIAGGGHRPAFVREIGRIVLAWLLTPA